MVESIGEKITCGIRINPEYSEVEVELYNPCAPGTRFGVTADLLPETLPEGIEGFHCHCHCESSSYELEHTLQHIEEKFASWFPLIKWMNLGGGHLITRKDYDTEHLISKLKNLKARYPHRTGFGFYLADRTLGSFCCRYSGKPGDKNRDFGR